MNFHVEQPSLLRKTALGSKIMSSISTTNFTVGGSVLKRAYYNLARINNNASDTESVRDLIASLYYEIPETKNVIKFCEKNNINFDLYINVESIANRNGVFKVRISGGYIRPDGNHRPYINDVSLQELRAYHLNSIKMMQDLLRSNIR